ncbi:MAG: hypothetical protein JRN39_00520 [Nitrososphaerota archaeon]|nr:hypothetical protein [Nitrososphaerota archaeon]MDG6938879.1 hypothetical protein [Nitrososphaerota archaeon]
MPEIWLPYGDVEIVVNIKAEHLSEVVGVADKALPEEDVLSQLGLVERPGLVVTDGSPAARRVLERLAPQWGPVPIRTVGGGEEPAAGRVEFGPVDGQMFMVDSALVDGRLLVVSEAKFDPVYGFYGSAPLVVEALGLRREALKRWKGSVSPGADTDPLWFAMRAASQLRDMKALEAVSAPRGVAHLSYGDAASAKSASADYLNSKRRMRVEPSRFVIIGCGGEDDTLSKALAVAANNLRAVAADAEVVVVAECGRGLGSAYLRGLADGTPAQKGSGGADEAALRELRRAGSLRLVSVLPKSIVEKRFGMSAHSSLGEALEAVERKHGWRVKATVLPEASMMMSDGQTINT